jgi:GTP-binding protein Era
LFKTAFITILGYPNAGKSTLLNALLGNKLVITNKKAQTTRKRIKGILNGEGYQLVFSDTPGIFEDSAYLLQEHMMKAVYESLEDADLLIILLDPTSPQDWEPLKKIYQETDVPALFVINKIDKINTEDQLGFIQKASSFFESTEIFPISALKAKNIDVLSGSLVKLAPEHPPYFDTDVLSDENVRFLVSELIREQVLLQFEKEIPYSSEVEITEYFEEKDIDKIHATIYLERDSQKVIMLGKKGAAIKKLGTAARKEIEQFIGKKVFLSLTIKVRKNWRKEELQLKRFGYIKK